MILSQYSLQNADYNLEDFILGDLLMGHPASK